MELSDPYERRRVLPHLLEVGPSDLVATIVTFPQLRTEWPYLDLTDTLRDSSELCYPGLGDDTGHHPSVATGAHR